MKKFLSIILCILMIVATLAGCNNSGQSEKQKKLKIVTTIFPIYDWLKNITDSADVDLSMIEKSGADLHNFQPTVEDIGTISTCDVFIYVGGESDKWVDDALKQKTNDDMLVINLMDVLKDKVKEEEIVEGMQADHDHEEEHDKEHDKEHEEEPEYDEHIWLSLKNARLVCEHIAGQLTEKDSANADTYQKNAEAYIKDIDALDSDYQTAVDNAKTKTLLFGDRFPFRYMVDDYGLSYYAAFVGCSAESEASFETIAFLSKKIDELKLKHILKIESSDGSVADAIKSNTKTKDQQILTLNSLQSVTEQDAKSADYLSIMRENLDTLKTALS